MNFKVLIALLCCALVTSACSAVLTIGELPDKYVTVAGNGGKVRLAYRDKGKGPPVLLIHGLGAHAYTWRHLEPELSKTHRVISLDLKGFGKSDKPLDERYSVFDQAKLVAAFIDRLRLKDVTLIGHSFGGGVALVLTLGDGSFAKVQPKRMVLIDTIAYPQKIPVFLQLLRMPVVSHVGAAVTPPELQAKAALMLAYHDDSKISAYDVAAYAGPLYSAGGRHALIYSTRQIVPANLPELARRYGDVKTPTLILWCAQDKIVPLEVGWRLHSTLPNSTFKMLHDCGHMPQEERPRDTARLIGEFLRQ